MTTTTDPPIALEPGWLRRAWLRHLDAASDADRPPPARHAYLWSTDLADVLEPFVLPRADLDAGAQDRIVRFDGLDARAAAALLADLPDVALQRNFSTRAPSPRKLLTAVVHGAGPLTCGGDVITPALPTGGLRLWSLTARDPAVLHLEPDLVAGELPSWLGDLPDEAYLEYVRGRQECLDHALVRQAWTRVSTRYRIDDARSLPTTRLLTDTTGGRAGVRFVW